MQSSSDDRFRLKWTILVFSILCMTLAGCWFQASMGSVSKASASSTGTLGKYKFASQEGEKTFNAKVEAWFSKKGYVRYPERNFNAITGMDSWETEGLVLCRQIDADNQFFAFIPQGKHPKESIQIVAYHMKLKGTIEEVEQHRVDFESENQAFREAFPDTWEPQP
jgi:hypothetical protein